MYGPATTRYLARGEDVFTPSVRTGLTKDIYLAMDSSAAVGDTTATIRVFIKPLVLWLWLGGGLMAVGTLLAAFPGSRRRRPTDPVSAPIGDGHARVSDVAPAERGPDGIVIPRPGEPEHPLEPVDA